MADVSISSLTQGTPAGNSILPYSTGSNTLGVPVSAMFQNVGALRIGGRLAIGAVDDPGPTSSNVNIELRGSNPPGGVMGVVYNNAPSPSSGAMIQFTQRNIGNWALGSTAGGINGFSLYRGRSEENNGTEAMRFDSSGNVEFFGSVKAAALQVPGCILQVKQTIITNTFSRAASLSYGDVTDFSVNITPASQSSKIMVMVNIGGTGNNNSSTNLFRFTRNGTALTTTAESFGSMMTCYLGTAGTFPVSFSLLDTPPSNTSYPITYKLQMRVDAGIGTVNIHNTNANYTAISTMTLWEIAG